VDFLLWFCDSLIAGVHLIPPKFTIILLCLDFSIKRPKERTVMSLSPEDYRLRTRFIIKLGRALHRCGANSVRIEEHLGNVTGMLGLSGSFLVSPTTFTYIFWLDDELDQFIHIERTELSDYNLGRLWEIDQLVESMEDDLVNFESGLQRLEILGKVGPPTPFIENGLASVVTGGAFATLLSPNPIDAIAAAFISFLLFLIGHITASKKGFKPALPIMLAFTAGALAMLIFSLGVAINAPIVILASIIIHIPGLALTVAMEEISHGHLISGCSRLVDGLMTLLKLFFGTLAGIAVVNFISPALLEPSHHLGRLPDWRIWPALVGLAISLGIAFKIPRNKWALGIISVFIAFGAAKIGEDLFGMYAGMFLGALSVGFFSNFFARLTKGPCSVLLIQGIIVLVPGSKVYSILNHWVSGEAILPAESGGRALIAFVALISGLIFANALAPARKTL